MSRTKHGFKGPSPVARNSTRHIALGVLKISTTPLTAQELLDFNPSKFQTFGYANKVLTELTEKAWAVESDGGFVLTEKGRKILFEMAARNPFRG